MLLLQHSLTLDSLEQHMVPIPAGSFDMGGDSVGNDAKPIHRVSLQAFELCRYPVTQALWEEIMGENPSRFKRHPQRPVENVSWNDTHEFINKLKIITEGNYRLPTEAEWEYAARGGLLNLKQTYSGSERLDEVGWFGDNSYKATHNIGQKFPNALGLYDMCGSVDQWCQDWYGGYGASEPQPNPQGPENGEYRMLRGGSWNYSMTYCRVAYRSLYHPDHRDNFSGFRLARSL